MAQANITSHVRLRNHISGYTDVIQMLTGVLLCCFVLMHMVLVSSVILSPKIMVSLAVFLETSYLAQIGGPIILLVMILHFILAARKMPFSPLELREFWRQAKMMHHMDTWLWLVQVATAIVILVMASAHVINILSNLPISADKSAAAIQGGMVPFYLVLFAALDLHIAIGLYRVGVKFGILNRENRLKWRKYALYLVIGLALLSLATHYSFATMAI